LGSASAPSGLTENFNLSLTSIRHLVPATHNKHKTSSNSQGVTPLIATEVSF
jgi:hypothetical protein